MGLYVFSEKTFYVQGLGKHTVGARFETGLQRQVVVRHLSIDVPSSSANMSLHQKLWQFGAPLLQGLNNMAMLTKDWLGPTDDSTQAVPIHSHKMIEIPQQHLYELLVTASGNESAMKSKSPSR